MQRWLVLLVTFILVALTAALGAWQLRRAAYKQGLAEQIRAQNSLPVGTNIDVLAPEFIANKQVQQQWLHRRVQLQGHWLHGYTVFLDNRPMQVGGQANGQLRVGFYVATPLALEGSNDVIWVQRGWVPRDFQDRTRLPVLPENRDTVTVSGRLMASVSKAYDMQPQAAVAQDMSAAASASSRLSRIWQNLPQFESSSSKTVLPLALLQTTPEAQSDGLLRDWPAADTGVAKHHGYAFQWFALSGTLVILYVWFQLIVPRRKQRSH
jgi:surfeit locus 1 family protein